MKLLLIMSAGLFLIACNRPLKDFAPNHLGISPSVEWEIQQGCNTKTKPKVQTSMDWKF